QALAGIVENPLGGPLDLGRDGVHRPRVGGRLVDVRLALGAHISLLPARARPSVTSSAYSRSPPTGSPLASRVTRVRSRNRSARYAAFTSPIASARARASASDALRRWNASRWAVRRPTPGRRAS